MTLFPYRVRQGESPAIIGRRFGVSSAAIVAANPHKPTTMVAGQRTFRSLGVGEQLSVPIGVGATVPIADPAAAHATIREGSRGPDVALWQTIIGSGVDGIFGPNTTAKTKSWQAGHGLAADGIVGPKSWAAALGGAFPAAPAASAPLPAPTVTPVSLPSLPSVSAPAAAMAIATIDPCYSGNVDMICAAQRALGITVDGKYGADTAAAIRKLVPNAPAGCSPRPSWWAPTGKSNCGGGAVPSLPAPTPLPMPSLPPPVATPVSVPAMPPVSLPTSLPGAAPVPIALQALASADPCAPSNSELVCAAQRVLGVTVDGKYGNDTANALRHYVPNAPAGCSPRPSWWSPTGSSNCRGAAPAVTPSAPSAPTFIPTPAPAAPMPVTSPAAAPVIPAGPVQPTVTPPSTSASMTTTGDKKLSTGAIVAGALGAAALVGVIAVATSKKKGTRHHSGGTHHAKKRKSSKKKRR